MVPSCLELATAPGCCIMRALVSASSDLSPSTSDWSSWTVALKVFSAQNWNTKGVANTGREFSVVVPRYSSTVVMNIAPTATLAE